MKVVSWTRVIVRINEKVGERCEKLRWREENNVKEKLEVRKNFKATLKHEIRFVIVGPESNTLTTIRGPQGIPATATATVQLSPISCQMFWHEKHTHVRSHWISRSGEINNEEGGAIGARQGGNQNEREKEKYEDDD